MIDLRSVFSGALWILGLAVILAALSWGNWEAKVSRSRLREALARPHLQCAIGAGFALFCAGLALAANRWWERMIWVVLGAFWLFQMAWALKQKG
jgi:hypothetical protein